MASVVLLRVGQHIPAAASGVGFFYAVVDGLPRWVDSSTALVIALTVGSVLYRFVLSATRRSERVYLETIDRLRDEIVSLVAENTRWREIAADRERWDRRSRDT